MNTERIAIRTKKSEYQLKKIRFITASMALILIRALLKLLN